MKKDTQQVNIEPPKFLFNFWAKGLVKNNGIIKIKKTIRKLTENK